MEHGLKLVTNDTGALQATIQVIFTFIPCPEHVLECGIHLRVDQKYFYEWMNMFTFLTWRNFLIKTQSSKVFFLVTSTNMSGNLSLKDFVLLLKWWMTTSTDYIFINRCSWYTGNLLSFELNENIFSIWG